MTSESQPQWPIEACPHCGRKYRIDPALAERKMRCRGCDKAFRIRGDGAGKRTREELVKATQGAGAAKPKVKPATSSHQAHSSAKPAAGQSEADPIPNLLDEVISSLHASGLAPAKNRQQAAPPQGHAKPKPASAKPAAPGSTATPIKAKQAPARPPAVPPADLPPPPDFATAPLVAKHPSETKPAEPPSPTTVRRPAGDAAAKVPPVRLANRCPVCQAPVLEEEVVTACPECSAFYHKECWDYNRGCAVYGCAEAAATEKLAPLEIPPSHWGRDEKECPVCAKAILAAAIRCKHCGTIFATADPQDSEGYAQQSQAKVKVPRARRVIALLLVLSLLPVTAPIAAVAGPLWYRANRATVGKLPAVHGALVKIAMGVAIGQTALLGLIVLAFKLLK